MKRAIIFALISFLVIGTVMADDSTMLLARYTHINCKIEASINILNDIMEKVPEADLSEHVTSLSDDATELESLANSGARIDFNNYVANTYLPNQVAANVAVREARRHFNEWNVSLATRAELVENYLTYRQNYVDCNFDALKLVAQVKLEVFNKAVENSEAEIARLSEKGVDTSAMAQVIEDTKATIITPFEEAINTATTNEEIREVIGNYHLWNGVGGLNFHYAAKLSLEKLKAILTVIEPTALEHGLEDQVDEVKSYLTISEDTLVEIELGPYTTETHDKVWDNLRNARQTIRTIIESIRSE